MSQNNINRVIRIPEQGIGGTKKEYSLLSKIPSADKKNRIDRVLIPESLLKRRIKALAQEICRDYADVNELYLLSVLKGAFVFASDLGREMFSIYGLEGPELRFDFIKALTYGEDIKQAQESERSVKIELRSWNLKGKDILLIEDIVDQGFTLWAIVQNLKEKEHPNSLKVCALLSKVLKNPTREVLKLKAKLTLDYLGFEVPDRWIAGYGIDAGGDFRQLPFIIAVREVYYLKKKSFK